MVSSQTVGTLTLDDSGPDKERPALVLLPGLTFDRHIWAPIVDVLRTRDPLRRVVAVDLPGHGDSPAQPPHDLARVAKLLHDALQTADVQAPVVVGHSISGALATLYAARFKTSGVVNVDQPPIIAPFAQLVRSLEPRLRTDFDDTWRDVFAASFHVELLPAQIRRLVTSDSLPSQQLVMSYWQMILEHSAEEIQATIDSALREIQRRHVPYLLLLGNEPSGSVLDLIRSHLPALDVEVWPGTGHFPHLAHPNEFVDLLTRMPTGQRGLQARAEASR